MLAAGARTPQPAARLVCNPATLPPYPPFPRQVLPPPVLMWKWGWTKSAEMWNGRIAMLALVLLLLLEATTGQGVLSQLLTLD